MSMETVTAPASSTGSERVSTGAGEEVLALLGGGDEGEEFAEDQDLEAGEDDGAEVADADSGGEESDRRSQSIPRQRFDQVLNERNEARQRLERLTPYEGFVQAISEHAGVTPEQAAELAGQIQRGEVTLGEVDEAVQEARQQQEAAAFEQWAREELDVDDVHALDPVQLRLAQREFQREGEACQQQQRQTLTQIKSDFDGLLNDFPELKAPKLGRAFLNDFGASHGIKPDAAAMRKHAEEFTADLKTLGRNQLSEEALAATDQANKRPNVSGGDTLGLGGDRAWIEDLSPEGEERFQKEKRGIFQRLLGRGR